MGTVCKRILAPIKPFSISLRSCFYPLLKEKINGKVGDIIDILGICTTLFGVVATLGYSAIRLAAAFHSMHLLDNSSYLVPLILVSVFIIAILISLQGIANGFRILSELNLGVTFLFMLLVLLFGPTIYLISAFTENIGTYLSGLIRVGFKAYAYDVEHFRLVYGLDGFLLGMVVFMGARLWDFYRTDFSRTNFARVYFRRIDGAKFILRFVVHGIW